MPAHPFPSIEQFKAEFGYEPCAKNWGGPQSCTCRRPAGHVGHCACGCGSRVLWGDRGPRVTTEPELRYLGEIPL